jgi:hypothetical protein
MKIGTQIIAPEGWKSVPKDVRFHFLCSDAGNHRILLVIFGSKRRGGSPTAELFIVNRSEFEEGCKKEMILPAERQESLPPWLMQLEGLDLSQIDRYRPPSSKVSHQQRVENRYFHIQSALGDIQSILARSDPQKEINKYAGRCKPKQHETRFRLWLFTYLCFGRNIWVLLPPFHHSGTWKRDLYPDTKFGAPSIAFGKNYGNGMNEELIEQCIKSYLKRAAPGIKMSSIYHDAMVHDFKCQSVTSGGGMRIYISPEGRRFPTESQFRYQIKKAIGQDNIQKTLYGRVRHRSRIAASKGRFSEEVSNLMERIEADGYFTKDRPRGYIDRTTLPALCVVIGRDVLSGTKIGIGFSFGAERNTAYRMMLFSMAVPKDFFCSLFGITLRPGEWTNEGLPGHFSVDRGPGARKNLIEEIEKRFPIRDMAPSWSGQSKATVESSHQRDIAIEGEPTFNQSSLTPVELAKREIFALIQYNNVADMEDRIDPDGELALITPSPAGLWNYYDKIFRNDAQSISIDDAVRTFLTPAEFSLRQDGIYLGARRYQSKELSEIGLFEKSGELHNLGTTLTGYVLDMCIRHVWVEVKGRIYMLEAVLRIRGDDETLWMSLSELAQWEEARKRVGSAFRVHKSACSSDIRMRFFEETGKSWDNACRRPGKPKKTAQARQEAKEVQQTHTSKKAA